MGAIDDCLINMLITTKVCNCPIALLCVQYFLTFYFVPKSETRNDKSLAVGHEQQEDLILGKISLSCSIFQYRVDSHPERSTLQEGYNDHDYLANAIAGEKFKNLGAGADIPIHTKHIYD